MRLAHRGQRVQPFASRLRVRRWIQARRRPHSDGPPRIAWGCIAADHKYWTYDVETGCDLTDATSVTERPVRADGPRRPVEIGSDWNGGEGEVCPDHRAGRRAGAVGGTERIQGEAPSPDMLGVEEHLRMPLWRGICYLNAAPNRRDAPEWTDVRLAAKGRVIVDEAGAADADLLHLAREDAE